MNHFNFLRRVSLLLFVTSVFAVSNALADSNVNTVNLEAGKQLVEIAEKIMKTPTALGQKSGNSVAWVPLGDGVLYSLIAILVIGMVCVLCWIRHSLVKSGWSLSDALSEDVVLPVFKESTDATGALIQEQVFNPANNAAVLAPQLRGSTSRLIALMGMVAILMLFICFGAVAIFSFGKTGSIPDGVEKIVGFLMTGTALFAPYALNKLISVFQTGTIGK
jgi:hypothetical protein